MVIFLSESVRLAATGSARKKIEDLRTRAGWPRHRPPHLLRPGRPGRSARVAGLNPYTRALNKLRACAEDCGRPRERLNPWLAWRVDDARKQDFRGPLSANTAPTALLPTQPTASLGPPYRRQPDLGRAGRGPCTRPLSTAPGGLRLRALRSPRASASAGSNYRCKSSMPPAGLPRARTAPDFAAPRLEADSSPSPPAAQNPTVLFAVEARLRQDRKGAGPDPCSLDKNGRGVQRVPEQTQQQ